MRLSCYRNLNQLTRPYCSLTVQTYSRAISKNLTQCIDKTHSIYRKKAQPTESEISSNVAEKDSTSSGGRSDTNPTVSIKRTVMPDGSFPGCAVTSRVAKSLSSGCILASSVNALIRVVLPVM